jgi:hypothetical protein
MGGINQILERIDGVEARIEKIEKRLMNGDIIT